jgi:GntR family transcriptional regulator
MQTARKVSPLPLYFKVRMAIQERIFSGHWRPGAQIPGEIELARELGVSVITVRQALSQLVDEGYIRRERAKGSFVSWDVPQRQSVKFDVEVEALITFPPGVRFKVVEVTEVEAPRDLADAFNVANGEILSRIGRIRLLEKHPLEYVVSHIPTRVASLIPEADLSRLPLPNAVEAACSTRITEVKHSVGAVLADEDVAHHLEMPAGSPVLLIERKYSSKKQTVMVSVGYYRSDLFRYELRLSRKAGH